MYYRTFFPSNVFFLSFLFTEKKTAQEVIMNRIWRPVVQVNTYIQRAFSTLNKPLFLKSPLHGIPQPPTISTCESNLLQPTPLSAILVNTWKYKVNVKKRCKGCYFVYREGVLHNQCHLKPKHKAILFHKKPKNTWILSGVSTNVPRPW